MTGRTQIGGRQILDGSVKTQDIEDLAVTDDKLSTSGVGSGTYTKLTVNTKGRVVAGENPTTLAGYGITDAAPAAPSFITVNAEVTLPNERRLIGTADQVSLVDGGGNSTIAVGIATDPVIPGTSGITIPSGTTAQRDPSPNVGEVRFNTDVDNLEVWGGISWLALAGGVSDHSALSGLTLDDHPQYVHTEINRTISATHTFNPTSPGTPFTIGANALNTLVTGLNADLLDGLNASAFQPVDLDLTAIAALATTGFPARTAANTWALRTITGTAGNIAVANGAGIAGDPTINLVTVGTAGTYRSVTTDAFGRVTAGTNPTTLAGYGITDAQPLDSDLTALAGTATTGLYTITGTGTSTTRTATGTANEIVVTNGSGVAGNPTFSISPDPIIPGTGSISLPDGTTAQRPVTPVNGMIRYNTTLAATEVYQNNQWYSIGTTVSGGVGILAVYTGSIPGVSGTTTVPYDNTVPLSTEGSQIWTTVVTPSKTTSLMKFTVPFTVDCSTSNRIIIASLYRDTLNIGTAIWFATGGGRPSNITMSVSDEPGTVTPVTYSMRVGIGAGGGTWYVNSTNSGNDFGGALLSSYEITEVG